MIVDTSAVVACLVGEIERAEFVRLLSSGRARISVATVLECALVLGRDRAQVMDQFIEEFLEVVPVDAAQLAAARDGWTRFGRGSGSPAKLNYGDCFSYALAITTGEPLLFKGDDFTHTDVTPAR